MLFFIILLMNFKITATELFPNRSCLSFIDDNSNATIPIPFFIDDHQKCVFLPPLSPDIWGNSLEDSYKNLPEKEQIKIKAGKKLCQTTSLPHFSVGNSLYQCLPIAAPSLKKFLCYNLEEQELSAYLLAHVLYHKDTIKIEVKKNNCLRQQNCDYKISLKLLSMLQASLIQDLEEEKVSNASDFLVGNNELQKKIAARTKEQEIIYNAWLINKNELNHSINALHHLKTYWEWTGLLDHCPQFKEEKTWRNFYDSLLPPPFQ